MKKSILTTALLLAINFFSMAQQVMTPEKLWEVKRMSVLGVSDDNSTIFYKLSLPNVEDNSFDSKYYKMP
ncbi:MAG: S9 family peptidase, partial [Mangrovimonas sp.]|nr:S9 family peptidase [Mangrovimonas sp.]